MQRKVGRLIYSRANETRERTRNSGWMPQEFCARARDRARIGGSVAVAVAVASLGGASVIPAATSSLTALSLAAITLSTRDAAAAAPALAQVLFEEGRALIARGRTEEACAKFAESNRLDPATGTLLNLAVCNESRGKTATAWEQFRAAEAASQYDRREDRVRLAREHIAQLEPRLSRVTLHVSVAQQVPGLLITLDGVQLERAAWNIATPIDPGEHVVVGRAPGRAARTWPLSVRSEPSAISVVIELEPAATLQASEGGEAAPLEPALTPDSNVSTTELLAYASGGVAVAGLIGGVAFGAQAFSRWDERNRLCPDDACVTPAAKRAQSSAESAARNANIAVGVGLVALVAAGVFYLLPESDEVPSSSEPNEAALSLSLDSVLSSDEVQAVVRGSW